MGSNEFELSITSEEESEAEDLPTCIHLPVSDISAVGSSTLHVLGLGQHELEAVLLVDTLFLSGTSHTQEISKDGSASTSLQEVNHYAFQCIEDINDAENGVNQVDDSSNHDGDSSHDSQGDAQELESNFGSKVYKLGMLEYVFEALYAASEGREGALAIV